LHQREDRPGTSAGFDRRIVVSGLDAIRTGFEDEVHPSTRMELAE
jgi:hypothetical protein